MTHYRPIAMPNMTDPVPIADQPSPMLQWVEIAAMVIDDTLAALSDAWFAALRAIAATYAAYAAATIRQRDLILKLMENAQ